MVAQRDGDGYSVRVRWLAALLAMTIIGTAAAGCGPESRDALGPTGSAETAEATGAADGVVDPPPTGTSDTAGLDRAGLDTELDAMERELDSMDMPSDADFSDAEGALD